MASIRRVWHRLAILACLFVAACATGPRFAPAPGPAGKEALIYLYRPWAFLHGTGSPRVRIDDGRYVDLTNGGYAVIRVPAGATRLSIRESVGLFAGERWPGEIRIDAVAGQTYYVRWRLKIADTYNLGGPSFVTGFVTDGEFDQVPADVGRAEIAATSRVEVNAPPAGALKH